MLQGSLADMAVPDLIQHASQGKRNAVVLLRREPDELRANLYFADGRLVHATMGEVQGDPVVFELLSWDTGSFILQNTRPTEERSVRRGITELLLEGARRLDESNKSVPARRTAAPASESGSDRLAAVNASFVLINVSLACVARALGPDQDQALPVLGRWHKELMARYPELACFEIEAPGGEAGKAAGVRMIGGLYGIEQAARLVAGVGRWLGEAFLELQHRFPEQLSLEVVVRRSWPWRQSLVRHGLYDALASWPLGEDDRHSAGDDGRTAVLEPQVYERLGSAQS